MVTLYKLLSMLNFVDIGRRTDLYRTATLSVPYVPSNTVYQGGREPRNKQTNKSTTQKRNPKQFKSTDQEILHSRKKIRTGETGTSMKPTESASPPTKAAQRVCWNLDKTRRAVNPSQKRCWSKQTPSEKGKNVPLRSHMTMPGVRDIERTSKHF